MPMASPGFAPSVSAPAWLIQSVPGAGRPRASRSAAPARSTMRKLPRSGNPSPSARRSPSDSDSPARIMLCSSCVSVTRRPGAAASARSASVGGASPRTTTSPPSRRFASIASARSARSVTKPTEVTATTASTSAANRMRMSPAARSRRNWRQASASVLMRPHPAGVRHPAGAGAGSVPPGGRRASPAPAWCRHRRSARTAAR